MTDDLYVIGRGVGFPAKVGRSKDVEKRLLALQTSSPYPLSILGIHKAMGVAEGSLHQTLPGRMSGEWFRWSKPIEELCNQPLPSLTTSRCFEIGVRVAHWHVDAFRWDLLPAGWETAFVKSNREVWIRLPHFSGNTVATIWRLTSFMSPTELVFGTSALNVAFDGRFI